MSKNKEYRCPRCQTSCKKGQCPSCQKEFDAIGKRMNSRLKKPVDKTES